MTADEIRELRGKVPVSRIACLAAKHLMPGEQAKAAARKRARKGKKKGDKYAIGRAHEIVAVQVGVSMTAVVRATSIMKQRPDLFEQVMAGNINLWAAYQQIEKRGYRPRTKKTKKGWTVKGAIGRINYAVEMELARYQRLGNDRSQYVAIGKWLEERGKRWNNVRGEGLESCGTVAYANGDVR
jgi:hypothetical protein